MLLIYAFYVLKEAFYILYILKEEEDFEFSGLSYLTKTVNFKQECLDECYKRFLRDITSQIGHSYAEVELLLL